MNFTCITLHNEELCTIVDASIPNKAQNQAVRVQVNRACDQLMNRIAEGWLSNKIVANGETDDNQVKHMVDRFLGWKLPENFNPDGGVSFQKTANENTSHERKNEPTGTNLFDSTQAEVMVRYMLEGLPK